MSHIVEIAPVLAEVTGPDHLVHGIWNSRDQTERVATERGHGYERPADGPVTAAALGELLARADALILAPTVAAATGMWQPADGEVAGRLLGHRLLDALSAERPELPIVLVSHFLVGHGVTHRNAKPNTWALHALEAHLRAGRNPYTIVRPTWLSTINDPDYRTRLTGDRNADGLVSTDSVARTVLTAIEHPESAAGRTVAVYDLSMPGATDGEDLAARFAALEPDHEARVREAVAG
ncbi:NAD(P)H-binding protein [Nocardia sp. NPDC057227]|uniref:NAD(P)H-binding protein n=1 Tax=Nocardia sp. NPDC057227 TaxID=3346056 RepID=UPI00362818DC